MHQHVCAPRTHKRPSADSHTCARAAVSCAREAWLACAGEAATRGHVHALGVDRAVVGGGQVALVGRIHCKSTVCLESCGGL